MTTRTRAMRVIAEPRAHTRNIVAPLNLNRSRSAGPKGATYLCGDCSTPLVGNVDAADSTLLQLVFRCNVCGSHNEFPTDSGVPAYQIAAHRKRPGGILERLLG